MNIEKEIKLKLNIDGYNKLMKLLKHREKINQINYYFDTEYMLLNKKDITLRIREEGDKFTLTLKVKKRIKIGITDSNEYSYLLTLSEVNKSMNRDIKI